MNGADGGADLHHTESDMNCIMNHTTGEFIRTATAFEIARYVEMVLALPSSQRHAGAVDGAEFGCQGVVFIDGYIAALDI